VNTASRTSEQRVFILRVSFQFRKVQVHINYQHINIRVASESFVMNFQPVFFGLEKSAVGHQALLTLIFFNDFFGFS
jgi:hypothetical protein